MDVDGLPVEVHGHQEGSTYNGHYGVRMYHPIVASIAETGDLLEVRLREGNVHSANGALTFIEKLLERVEKEVCEVAAVRFDAGFPEEKLLAKLEERRTPYVARVRNTSVLKREAALPRFLNSGVPQGEGFGRPLAEVVDEAGLAEHGPHHVSRLTTIPAHPSNSP